MDENHRMSTLILTPADVEPVARTLVGAIDVDGGPTDEQVAVLRALLVHLWNRPDLEPSSLAALDPAAAADGDHRTRRPAAPPRVDRGARSVPPSPVGRASGPGRGVRRRVRGVRTRTPDLPRLPSTQAPRAPPRTTTASTPTGSKTSRSRGSASSTSASTNPTSSSRRSSRRCTTCPTERSATRTSSSTVATASPCPAQDTHTPAHYVSHDMNHVIAGYEPTGPGELALAAFTLAMRDDDANWIQFIDQPHHSRGRDPSARRDHAQGRDADSSGRGRPLRRRIPSRRRSARATSARPTTSRWPRGRSLKCARITACRKAICWAERED